MRNVLLPSALTSILRSRVFTSSIVVMAVMSAMHTSTAAVVRDYQFVGLERLTPANLLALLPAVGQDMSDEALAHSIRTLYRTGQFSNVQAENKNGVVQFRLTERPIIAEVKFHDNKLIPSEGLEKGLKQAGLSAGQVLKQATLTATANELKSQYLLQGYYNSDIKVVQTLLEGNRVALDIYFTEGNAAKVIDINIIGNHFFDDDDIKRTLLLKEKSWNFLSKADRYADDKLQASLVALQNQYADAGFARFAITSSSVSIDQEKNHVFVEIAVDEGERYHFGKSEFFGHPIYDPEVLAAAVTYQAGDQYSKAQIDATVQQLVAKFGDDGYYHAEIYPVPRIDDDARVVAIDYHIDPKRPIYVRRINFSGNIKTKDEVLRREMRQLEGALSSNEKIQLSRARLMHTGYFKEVKVQTRPVPGSPDQMDVDFIVEEQPSGSATIAAGYSQGGGLTFQLDFAQNNFMGTGNKVNVALSRSQTLDSYNVGYTDPYLTINGVSQNVSAYYRKTKADKRNISNYILNSTGGSLIYGYPIDENQRLNGGFNFDKTDLIGGRFMAISNVYQMLQEGGSKEFAENYSNFSNKYTTYNMVLGWDYSSLDKPIFPNKGMSHALDLKIGSKHGLYQKAVYQGNIYQPLPYGMVLRAYTKLGYGHNLPFYENFYAGGYGSVRGYEASSLGPQSYAYQSLASASTDSNGVFLASGRSSERGEVAGGNALASFGAELVLPIPFKGEWANQIRPVVFIEGGQVFDTSARAKQTIDLATINPALANLSSQARMAKLINQDNSLRYSAGVGATWYTPIGPLSISYAIPFGNKPGDRTEKVQFQIGNTF